MAISVTPIATKEILNGVLELVADNIYSVKVGSDNLSERKWLYIQNSCSVPVYIGSNTSNGTAITAYLLAKRGIKLKSGTDIWLPVADTITIYARLHNSASVKSGRLRIMEMA